MNPFADLLNSYIQNPSEGALKESLKELFRRMPVIKNLGLGRIRLISINPQAIVNRVRYYPQLLIAGINSEVLSPNFRLDGENIFFKGQSSPFAKENIKAFLVENKLNSEELEWFCFTLIRLSLYHETNMESMDNFVSLVKEVFVQVEEDPNYD